MATTLLLMILLRPLVATAAAQRQPPVALRGCRDTCGDVIVPYPFGTGCYLADGLNNSRGFEIACDDNGPSPPRLTIVGRGYRLAALSLTSGEATTYLNETRTCYDSRGEGPCWPPVSATG